MMTMMYTNRLFRIMTSLKVTMAPAYNSLMSSSRHISMKASPYKTLMDEDVEIEIDGLLPRQPVTIRSYFDDEGKQFESYAHYTSSEQGNVCTTAQPSEGGLFTGVEPMGLFWSMIPRPGIYKRGTRYMKQDVTKPLVVNLSIHDGHLDGDQVRQDDTPMTGAAVERWYMSDNVEAIKVKDGRVRGTVMKPKGPGPFPGIIDMFGGVLPGCNEIRAALLASRGYATLALSYFGGEDQPVWSDVKMLDIEYFEEATDWLSSQSYIKPGGIASIGICKGGELALAMGVNFPEKIRALVSISSSGILSMCPSSYKGKMLPFDTRFRGDTVLADFAAPDGAIHLADVAEIDYSVFQQFENIRCPVLAFCGADDQAVANDHSHRITEMINSNDHTNNCELIVYPGTGHLIEPPNAPICTESYQPPWGIMKWGGVPVHHAHAQQDAWQRLLVFLQANMVDEQRQHKSKL